ncbi:Uncharacterised protein [Mycobacteroides abscessus subsp. abscessus]|nr:Uncharacterised protein [Mycobacteroides abscessus subsp. abscessus]
MAQNGTTQLLGSHDKTSFRLVKASELAVETAQHVNTVSHFQKLAIAHTFLDLLESESPIDKLGKGEDVVHKILIHSYSLMIFNSV